MMSKIVGMRLVLMHYVQRYGFFVRYANVFADFSVNLLIFFVIPQTYILEH